MCGGGGGGGASAAELQAETDRKEAERQQRIRQGVSLIDREFAKFDDPFYQDFQNSFVDFYTPQIDQQFNDAQGQLVARLADRGMLESTSGLARIADLKRAAERERTLIANQAVDQATALRGNVERERSNLFALNEGAADPARVGSIVQNSATALRAPTAFEPLGDVFSSVLNDLAAFNTASQNNPQSGFTSRRTASPTPTGSGRVVRG